MENLMQYSILLIYRLFYPSRGIDTHQHRSLDIFIKILKINEEEIKQKCLLLFFVPVSLIYFFKAPINASSKINQNVYNF